MKKYLSLSLVMCFIIITGFTSKHHDAPTNYYGIPESLNFGALTYNLSWSSHPNDNYYKQEYIPKDNEVDNFKDMVLIDFIKTDLPVSTAVDAQVATIKERKKTDAVCNYQLINNASTGEYILDFIMSQSKDDAVTLVEWNGYLYKPYTDKSGHKGVLLFGISHRAYNNEVNGFLSSLGKYRHDQLKALTSYEIPQIQIQ
ncbi:hypothetical protein HDF18_20340 [Mucilaginibacter sp. X5P1]|uniref:hypothetical protein n=1 Tax=Mucilaginibacter sp. X5P1 TaxID=2723088 RepID=UPI00160FBD92|nr:hypothetical protein [Mucilaginibacter sp. X5P1]MBB6139952.1 hypothetical protein [Mucilaginibacter sp. X5P1]